jgi:hypothetical protein
MAFTKPEISGERVPDIRAKDSRVDLHCERIPESCYAVKNIHGKLL